MNNNTAIKKLGRRKAGTWGPPRKKNKIAASRAARRTFRFVA